VTDAKHDVFLSIRGPRQLAYRHLDQWLDHYLGTDATDASQASASSGKG
jgi:alpha-beta hydrolase superfamily lysophospholipase